MTKKAIIEHGAILLSHLVWLHQNNASKERLKEEYKTVKIQVSALVTFYNVNHKRTLNHTKTWEQCLSRPIFGDFTKPKQPTYVLLGYEDINKMRLDLYY